MSIFYEILECSKLHSEIIALWTYKDSDGFWCGYILDYNDTVVKIQHYTKYGKKDGIVIAQLSDIKSIDFNDDYAKAMQFVIDNSEEIYKESEVKLVLHNDEDWQLSILKQLEANYNTVSCIEINNSENYCGYIEKVSDYEFIIKCIGKLGEDEGSTVYSISDITGFYLDDIENRKRNMLYKWRNGFKL
jgi:hypothetical protein